MTFYTPRLRAQKRTRKPSGLKLLLAGLLLTTPLIFASEAYAQRVSPMAYELEPSGSGAQQNLTIENTSQSAMTIELFASKISIDDDGIETTAPAEDDFLIFPPQAIVKPGKKQTVRLKYIGDPSIEMSSAYRVSVKQVAVDITGEGQSAVGLVVNFNTLASVSPKGSKSNLVVKNISQGADGKWSVTLANTGKKLARLSRTKWEFSDGSGNKKAFSSREVAAMFSRNLVMPGTEMTISMPAISGLDAGSSKVEITVTS